MLIWFQGIKIPIYKFYLLIEIYFGKYLWWNQFDSLNFSCVTKLNIIDCTWEMYFTYIGNTIIFLIKNFAEKKPNRKFHPKRNFSHRSKFLICRKKNKVTKSALQWQIFIYEKISRIIPHDMLKDFSILIKHNNFLLCCSQKKEEAEWEQRKMLIFYDTWNDFKKENL